MSPVTLSRPRRGVGAGMLALGGVALLAFAAVRALRHLARHALRAVIPAASHYLRWFWRLPLVAKFAVTAAEIILLQLALPLFPLGALERHEATDFIALALVGLLLVGILFGSTGARAR